MSNNLDSFNPRSREGSDRTAKLCLAAVKQVSIHAPVKGATAQLGL